MNPTPRPHLLAALAATLLGFAPLAASADTWTDEQGNTWTYSGSIVTAVSCETTTLTIPSTLGGNPVTGFLSDVFAGQTRAVRVTIPPSVTSIPDNAFRDCSSLRSVTIQGTGLRSIGMYAFSGCANLASFTVPDSVTSLGRGAFSGCSALETVTLGNGIDSLSGVLYGWGGYSENTPMDYDANTITLTSNAKGGLFANCTSLETIHWGTNVKAIGNVAFFNCSSLKTVAIPDTVESIGAHAFFGCSNLETVAIGDSVTNIGRMAFWSLPKLREVSFGRSLEHIGAYAFRNCANLRNFTLPATLRQIDFLAFAGCNRALTEMTIPTNANGEDTQLGWGVFADCTSLAAVTFGDTVKTLSGVPCDGWDKTGADDCYYEDSVTATEVKYYDDGVSLWPWEMKYGLFHNCTSLKTIHWGANVKTIGNCAFHNCTGLEQVEIPDTVTSIGCHAFLNCTNLTQVTIGNKVTTIGRMAFRACRNLAEVTFGARVEHIAQQAFQDCANLGNFTLPDSLYRIELRAFAGCSNALTTVEIPTNADGILVELGEGVFSGCSSLETVTLGDTVKALPGVVYDSLYYDRWRTYWNYTDYEANSTLEGDCEYGFFYNCTSLKTINWGSKIKSIGNLAFLNCSALKSVELPATVSDIGCHAFFGCTSLQKAVVAGSVSSIGRRAFANCPALSHVDFQGTEMTSDPGGGIFDFDADGVTAYAALGSTGWTGVLGVGGLPADGRWEGARILYGPPPGETVYEVVLDRQGGMGGTASVTATYGSSMPSIAVPALTGYTFGGYYSEANGGGTQYYTAEGTSARTWDQTAATTLYAKWTEITHTQIVAGIKWSYAVSNGMAKVTGANPAEGIVEVPATLGGCPVKCIGSNVFAGCSGLTSIAIPDSVERIGPYAFSGCTNLTAVHIHDLAAWCEIEFLTSWDTPLCYEGHLYLDGQEVSDLVIPPGVTELKFGAFTGCRGLTNVVVPDGIAKIGQSAFYECRDLASAVISDTVTEIENGAFSFCTELTNVVIGASITNLGNWAFAMCAKLKTLEIPDSVVGVGENALFYCVGLEKLYVSAAWKGTDMLSNAGVPEGCTVIYRAVPEEETTSTGVPHAWIDANAADILAANGGDHEAAAKAAAANGMLVWACYVAGLLPTDAAAAFKIKSITFAGGEPVIEWAPDLGEDRSYVVEGKADMEDEWGPRDASSRFFRVKVVVGEEPPEPPAPAHTGVQLWKDGPYWAETNIGAESPEDYGLYFWWGDTVGYRWEGDAWAASDGSTANFSFDEAYTPTYGKNNATLQSEGWITAKGALAPEHDAAQVHWGGGWRMPTDAEFAELIANTTTIWTNSNGVYGQLVTGKGGYASASIFLPAAGSGRGLNYSWSSGNYWSSTPYSLTSSYADGLQFVTGSFYRCSGDRYIGNSVRALRDFAE